MKYVSVVFLFFIVAIGFAQNKVDVKNKPKEKVVVTPVLVNPDTVSSNFKVDAVVSPKIEITDYSQIFEVVEIPAHPKEGMNVFRETITNLFRLPEVDNAVLATVIAKFVVWDDGSIRDIQIIKEQPYGLGLGKEAVRILKTSENWIPGQVQGKNVKQYYTFPISLQLKEKNEIVNPIEVASNNEIRNDAEKNVVSKEKKAAPSEGFSKFYSLVASNIQVPDVEVAGTYKTRVKFIVNQDGSLSDFQVLEETPTNVGLGQNVILYLQQIKKWEPSEQNGIKVKTYYILPVTLYIEAEKESNEKKEN